MLIDLNTLKAIVQDVEAVDSHSHNPEIFLEQTSAQGFVYTIAGDNGPAFIKFGQFLATLSPLTS